MGHLLACIAANEWVSKCDVSDKDSHSSAPRQRRLVNVEVLHFCSDGGAEEVQTREAETERDSLFHHVME